MNITPQKRYKYLIEARNYHYAQFNIWMAFFLAIIGALFMTYGNLSSAEDKDLFAEKILVSVFGYMVSLLFHLSSKGYYYWITNWIKLIMDCENKFASSFDFYRVYSCFANKKANNNYCSPIKGANISTSKIVCFLSYLFTFAFGILFLHNLEQSTLCTAFELDSAIIKIILSITLIFIANVILCLLADVSGKFNSDINNHIDFNIQPNTEAKQ
jgi:hypothetical protein